MPSIIQAGNAASTGLVTTGATDGILELRSGTAAGGTVAMTINAAGNITVPASAAPAFSAFGSAATTINNVTNTKIILQTKEFDTAGAFDATTTYRFTPLVAGYYQVNGGIAFSPNATGFRFITIFKNGTAIKGGQNLPGGSTNFLGITVAALVFLNGSTDYLELFGNQNSGSTLTTTTSASETYFQAFLARSA